MIGAKALVQKFNVNVTLTESFRNLTFSITHWGKKSIFEISKKYIKNCNLYLQPPTQLTWWIVNKDWRFNVYCLHSFRTLFSTDPFEIHRVYFPIVSKNMIKNLFGSIPVLLAT